jgi:type I restriction enzyme M protein
MRKYMEAAWKPVRMYPAIRGIDADLGLHNADSSRADLLSDLKADFILANPQFNERLG